MSGRSEENRYRRDIDPFAWLWVGDRLAMAEIEGRRRPEHEHDHLPDLWDKEPWSDKEQKR